MSRLFYHVMQDNAGNLLFDVSGTMRVAGSGTLATIYGDEALTVILPNPMTNHPSFGSFKCFLGVGDYDFYMAKAGYTFETLTGVQGSGSMADQNANAVAITGGQITLPAAYDTGGIHVMDVASADVVGLRMDVTVGTSKHNLFCGGTAYNYLEGNVGIARLPVAGERLSIAFASGGYAFVTHPTTAGMVVPLNFLNNAGTSVGTISNTDSATAYNTSSDGRLKEAITALPDALATIQRLLPVRFRWKRTGEVGHGFIAQDVQPILPQAVTGDPADPTPNMQMDLSKLVPHLVGALKELAAQVETLTARLAAVEGGAVTR